MKRKYHINRGPVKIISINAPRGFNAELALSNISKYEAKSQCLSGI